MASSRELDALIRVSGEVDRSVRNAIRAVSDQMDTLQEAARRAQGASADLSDTIRKQGKTLKAAQAQYASYVLNGQEASQEAQQLADEIRRLSSDLNRNKAALSAAERAASSLADEMDDAGNSADDASNGVNDLGDAAKRSSSGFTVMKGVLADLISSGIQKLVSTATDAAKSLWRLSEQTREFRADMATLETAYDSVGFSSEAATETWKDLYSILGEDDRAVETANNISRMAKSQQDLDKWVTISTGVLGKYQDALPVENLAEAAAETAKTGTVTGGLADALNWSSEAAAMFSQYMNDEVVTAEDAFNEALKRCSNEQERQNLITDTMMQLYGGAAEKYRETAGSIMEARDATAEYSLKTAELGERMEPVTTAVQTGINRIIDKILELTSSADMQGFADSISGAFDYFLNSILPKIMDGLGWIRDNKDVIIAGIIGIGTAFATWQVVGIVTAAVAAFKSLTAAIAAGKTVMQALNITMSANPIGFIITIIASLVAAFIYLWNTSEGFRNFWIGLWEAVKSAVMACAVFIGMVMSQIGATISAAWNAIKSTVTAAVTAVVSTVTSIWSGLVGIISGIWNGILSTLSGIWNTIKSLASGFANGVKSTISAAWSGLTNILTAPFRSLSGIIEDRKSVV